MENGEEKTSNNVAHHLVNVRHMDRTDALIEFLKILSATMNTPDDYGWFHLLFIFLLNHTINSVIIILDNNI